MRVRWLAVFLVFLVLPLAAVLHASIASARGSGKVALSLATADVVTLAPAEGGFVGSFSIRNTGAEPLTVSRIALRGDEQDARLPSRLSVRFAQGGVAATIAPGDSKLVSIRWMPDRDPRMKQALGHVIVTSTDEGAGEVAVVFRAQVPQPIAALTTHALSWLVILPLFGVVFALLLHVARGRSSERARERSERATRVVALTVAAAQAALALFLYARFSSDVTRADGNDGMQFIEHTRWVPGFYIEYFVGIDGLSISMIFLTALVSFVGVLASFSIEKQLKGYFAMYLLLVTGMMGTFLALDLFLFFVFWEVMLLPMYFLIGIWGGPRKEYAAIKFFLYTLAGSVLMLLAIIALYLYGEPTYLVSGAKALHTFSVPELARVDFLAKGLTILGMSFVKVVWIGFFIGFAIKIPMFPFHTWLPDAHVEAPTAISVILAGVLLKMGIYGILRFNFAILPEATRWAAPAMAAFGVINILYGAFCAMAQEDLKKLVAYSSVSHMGYCLLGMAALTPQGIAGCMAQLFAHGIITSMLFSLVGVIYDRAHTRDLSKFGGLAGEMPIYTAFVGFAFMASLGLPGLAGFVAEILTFMGAFPVYRVMTILAATGVIFTAGYHLWALQRMFLGKFNEGWRKNHYLEPYGGKFPEINGRELATLIPLAVLVLYLGFYPKPLLDTFQGAISDLGSRVNPSNVAAVVRDTGKAYALVK